MISIIFIYYKNNNTKRKISVSMVYIYIKRKDIRKTKRYRKQLFSGCVISQARKSVERSITMIKRNRPHIKLGLCNVKISTFAKNKCHDKLLAHYISVRFLEKLQLSQTVNIGDCHMELVRCS